MILRDFHGNSESRAWIARHRLRKEFGLTAAEADAEPYDETMIHMKIWSLEDERRKKEYESQQRRNRINTL